MKILFVCVALGWISLCLGACSFDAETGTSTCDTYTQWTEGVGGAVSWAKDCDFTGHDIAKIDGSEHNCGKLCYKYDKGQCTHFTWSKGICYIKSNARRQAEEPNKSIGDVCGYVVSRTDFVRVGDRTMETIVKEAISENILAGSRFNLKRPKCK